MASKYHFPSSGLVVISYHILDDKGLPPLDSKKNKILLVQRNLSGEISQACQYEHLSNTNTIPLIIVDYHQKLMITLNKWLIGLTVVLTVLTLLLLFITKNSLVK
jgi:hypothetical protein